MITLYKLYDLTGYHPHSRRAWLRKHFGYTTKEAKTIQINDLSRAYECLKNNSRKPNFDGLHIYFPNESHSNQMIDIMNKDREEEFKIVIRNCSNCLYNGEDNLCDCSLECIDFYRHVPGMKVKNVLPGITKDDYEVLKNSFDDLLEMYQNQERRLLVLEKRLELPKRAFRNEIINAINTICHKEHREQHTVYKEVYQGFDIRYGLKDKTKNIKTTYLEWYDQNDYLPRLLNYIKEVYKV